MAASFVGQKELDLRYDIPLEANVIVGGNSDVVEMPIPNKGYTVDWYGDLPLGGGSDPLAGWQLWA